MGMASVQSNGIVQNYPEDHWQDYALRLQQKCKELEGNAIEWMDKFNDLDLFIDYLFESGAVIGHERQHQFEEWKSQTGGDSATTNNRETE